MIQQMCITFLSLIGSSNFWLNMAKPPQSAKNGVGYDCLPLRKASQTVRLLYCQEGSGERVLTTSAIPYGFKTF